MRSRIAVLTLVAFSAFGVGWAVTSLKNEPPGGPIPPIEVEEAPHGSPDDVTPPSTSTIVGNGVGASIVPPVVLDPPPATPEPKVSTPAQPSTRPSPPEPEPVTTSGSPTSSPGDGDDDDEDDGDGDGEDDDDDD